MNLKCVIGIHEWDGCKCQKCGKTQDEGHDWSKDCEKCEMCGKTRNNAHEWDGCKCSTCGKTRDEGHDWSKDCEKCDMCGKMRNNAHEWDGCKCSTCGKTRDEGHDWSKDCEKCEKCGKERNNAHKWDGCMCSQCPAVQRTGHTISYDQYKGYCSFEYCRRCGLLSHETDRCCGLSTPRTLEENRMRDALQRWTSESAVQRTAQEDPDPRVRCAAGVMLRSFPVVQRLMLSPDDLVRRDVIEALAIIGGEDAIRALRRLYWTDREFKSIYVSPCKYEPAFAKLGVYGYRTMEPHIPSFVVELINAWTGEHCLFTAAKRILADESTLQAIERALHEDQFGWISLLYHHLFKTLSENVEGGAPSSEAARVLHQIALTAPKLILYDWDRLATSIGATPSETELWDNLVSIHGLGMSFPNRPKDWMPYQGMHMRRIVTAR